MTDVDLDALLNTWLSANAGFVPVSGQNMRDVIATKDYGTFIRMARKTVDKTLRDSHSDTELDDGHLALLCDLACSHATIKMLRVALKRSGIRTKAVDDVIDFTLGFETYLMKGLE